MLGISGPSGVALLNFCETLPSMVKLLNDLLRGFAKTPPENAPPINGQRARLSRASSFLGARPVWLGRLHLSGWDPTKIRMGACVE